MLARFDALRDTQRAFLAGELGADAALRQAYIDLAAAGELCAVENGPRRLRLCRGDNV